MQGITIEDFTALTEQPRCQCPPDARGPWDCTECPLHGEEAEAEVEAQARSEQQAESAWLRHAENGMDDCPEWAR